MSTNIFTINGKDALSNWGASLGDGSVSALLTPAPAKEVSANDSPLADGVSLLPGTVRLDRRDVSLVFHIRASGYAQFQARLNGLVNELRSAATAKISLGLLPDVAFRLSYVSCQTVSQVRGELGKAVIKFSEPNPTDRES